jgi:hypothetical protein
MGVKLEVMYDEHITNLGGNDPDDRWTRDSTDRDITITGLQIVDKCFDTVCQDDVVIGDQVGLLWAKYSTGDSFGNDGGQCEFIQVLPLAKMHILSQNAETIMSANESKSYSSYSVELLDAYGETYTLGCPWYGYFEHLQSVDIKVLTVGSADLHWDV